MKKAIISILCYFFVFSLFAQPKYFEKTLPLWADVQDIQSVIALPDSSFVLVGNYTYVEPIKWFAHTTKITKNADIVWQTLFNNAGESLLFDVIQGNFGYYATTGTLAEDYIGNSINTMCSYFVNNAGYLQSLSNYGVTTSDSRSYRITRSADGGYLSVGYLVNGGYSHYTLYVVKLNAVGEKQWQKIYPIFNSHCQFRDVIAAPDGGYYLTGSVNMNWDDFVVAEGNMLLMKIDSIGNVEWSKVHNVGSMDQALSFIQTNSNDFLISGGSAIIGAQKMKPYLLKTSENGDFIWGKRYFVSDYGEGGILGSSELSDGYMTAGFSYNIATANQDIFILRTDEDGNALWYRTYGNQTNSFGGNAHEYAYDMTPTLDGGYMIVGRKDSMLSETEGYAYAWLVKTNCMGLLTVPQAQFTLAQDPDFPNRYLFTNQSQYAYPDSIDGGHYILNWGDGSPPFICGQGYAPCNQDTLIHTYQAESVYGVTLQAIVCNDTSTHTQTICLGISPNPQAAFSYEDTGGTILFTNLSQNAYIEQGGTYLWDFGDGNPPVYTTNPNHSYEENGSYTVTLTLVVCADTSVYTQEVVVQTVGLPPGILPPDPLKGENYILVYPNPAQNTLTLQWVSKSTLGDLGVSWEISLFSPTGQQVLQTTIPSGQTSHSLSVAHLPVGVYFYVVEDGGAVLARGKVAVVR